MAKRGKTLTREMKEILSGHGQFPNKWLFVKQVTDSYMEFQNVETGKIIIIDIYRRDRRWAYEEDKENECN